MSNPLTPPDCDLRDFSYMPIDVSHLLSSNTWILGSGSERAALIALQMASWHQVPAASIPDNDKWLAIKSGSGPRWKRHRSVVLSEWILCTDGRLYHPTISARALIGWKKKQSTARKIDRRIEIESGEWAAIRSAVFARDDYTCTYCGKRAVRLEADHIHPVSLGGVTAMENLTTACKPCNRSKGAKPLQEFRHGCH